MFRKTRRRARRAASAMGQAMAEWRGYVTWRNPEIWRAQPGAARATPAPVKPNDLRRFFEQRREGRGIWKWNHYFDIYDRHFSRFRGTDVRILEIGIYSGGSLEMWKDYFGPLARVYGVDIKPECKAYESDSIEIMIGDQADRSFWRAFKQRVPRLDIVVDDGGHKAAQQIVTFEELFPWLAPGGVYLCEDLHGVFNGFAGYMHGFAHNLNAHVGIAEDRDNNERRSVCRATALQSAVRSTHFYPFVAVVEKTDTAINELIAPKHGTQWAPFLR
jgi:hypothetical protein